MCSTPACGTRGRRTGERAVIYRFEDRVPRTEGETFVAPTAVVIGSVVLRHQASVWWGAVLRGDYDTITVGPRTNIQDNCVVHMDEGYPVTLGARVTVGHKAVLHGCTVGDNSLIGINAVVMNAATIGANCLIGSGALITEGKTIPPRSLVLGAPGRVVRTLTDAEVRDLTGFSDRYVRNFRRYKAGLAAADP